MGAKYKIYNSYILSIFRYLVPVWGNCSVTNFDKIQVLQNRALKTLYQLDYWIHTEELYRVLKVLPIADILKIEQSKSIYKIINNLQKSNTEIRHLSQIHNYNTRHNDNICLGKARTNIALRNPIKAAADIFNNLSPIIKNQPSFGKFLR